MNNFISNSSRIRDRKSEESDFFGPQESELFIAPSQIKSTTNDLEKIQRMLKMLCQANMLNQIIALPTNQGLDFIQVKKIIRCEGCKKYTLIYTTESEPILSSYNIGKYSKLFEDITVFFLSHKSHLVNINYIKNYNKDGLIQMVDDTIVPVSVRKRHVFMDLITHL